VLVVLLGVALVVGYFCVEMSMASTPAIFSLFAERAQAFTGSAVHRLLHRQRLARRMAKESEHRFSPDDLLRSLAKGPERSTLS
jgi:hypothetical protein